MEVDRLPEKLVIDEDYDLPRTLSSAEFPPVIARLLGTRNRSWCCLLPGRRSLRRSSGPLRRRGSSQESESDRIGGLQGASLAILGIDNPWSRGSTED